MRKLTLQRFQDSPKAPELVTDLQGLRSKLFLLGGGSTWLPAGGEEVSPLLCSPLPCRKTRHRPCPWHPHSQGLTHLPGTRLSLYLKSGSSACHSQANPRPHILPLIGQLLCPPPPPPTTSISNHTVRWQNLRLGEAKRPPQKPQAANPSHRSRSKGLARSPGRPFTQDQSAP